MVAVDSRRSHCNMETRPRRPMRAQSRDQGCDEGCDEGSDRPLPGVRRTARPRRGRRQMSRSYRATRNCRYAAAASRRPPSGPRATGREWRGLRDTKLSCEIPDIRARHRTFMNYAPNQVPVSPKVPQPTPDLGRIGAFLPVALCHIQARNRLLATDDTEKWLQAPLPAPRWSPN